MKKTPKQQEYAELVKKKSPKSHLCRDMFRAFWVGGLICCIGQAIYELLMLIPLMDNRTALSFTAAILVFTGALLTGLGIYTKIGKYGGAGSVVPITGFSNSIVSPAIEFKQEGLVMGIGSKLFTVAGPVLVYGISASVIIGIIYYILGVI